MPKIGGSSEEVLSWEHIGWATRLRMSGRKRLEGCVNVFWWATRLKMSGQEKIRACKDVLGGLLG